MLPLLLSTHIHQFIIFTQIVLEDSYFRAQGFRFIADISRDQHAHFNQSLNRRVVECADAAAKRRRDSDGATDSNITKSSPAKSPDMIYYKHIKESDEFYEVSDPQTGRVTKARASRDKATDKIIRMIAKRAVADLHIHFPFAPFDCRLTLSTEEPVKIPASLPPMLFAREKDRISYRSGDGLLSIDLTQVRQSERVMHELELELIDIPRLLNEKSRLASGLPNEFVGIMGRLMQNIRSIIVKSSAILVAASSSSSSAYPIIHSAGGGDLNGNSSSTTNSSSGGHANKRPRPAAE